MAKGEQLNTSVSPEIYTRFCGIAAERNLSNAALLRDIVEELIEAYDAGRAIFQKEAGPRLDTTVSGLVHQLKEIVIEMDGRRRTTSGCSTNFTRNGTVGKKPTGSRSSGSSPSFESRTKPVFRLS